MNIHENECLQAIWPTRDGERGTYRNQPWVTDDGNRLYHVIRGKYDHRHTFKTSKNGDIQWIWSGGWEWRAVSGVIGRWSWFYLHIYASKYVYFWILQRRLARHWGAGVIHAGSRRGYLEKISLIELCMVDKGFQGMQYQKTTLASNPKSHSLCT